MIVKCMPITNLENKKHPNIFPPTQKNGKCGATDKDWHVFLELLIWIRMRFNILLNFLNFCLDDKNMTHHPILLLKIFFSILPETWKRFQNRKNSCFVPRHPLTATAAAPWSSLVLSPKVPSRRALKALRWWRIFVAQRFPLA